MIVRQVRSADWWERQTREHYWLVPTGMAMLAAGLAILLVHLDEVLHHPSLGLEWLYGGDPRAARRLLSAIAAAMIALISLTFSVTMTAVTFVSQHFGSRVLRHVMRDRGEQVILGTYIATFVYALLVFRTLQDTAEDGRFPQLAITLVLVLALSSVGVLIYGIYHLTRLLEAPNLIDRIGRNLDRLIETRYGGERGRVREAPARSSDARRIPASSTGYLVSVQEAHLTTVARRHGVVIRVLRRPGEFVAAGAPVAEAWPGDRVDDRVLAQVTENLVIGFDRGADDDVLFAVTELVQATLRALAGGRFDTPTAITCLDRLTASLCRLAGRETSLPLLRADREGQVRLIAPRTTGAEAIELAFGQISDFRPASSAVMVRVLENLTLLAGVADDDADRAAVARMADKVLECAHQALTASQDREALERAHAACCARLGRHDMPAAMPHGRATRCS